MAKPNSSSSKNQHRSPIVPARHFVDILLRLPHLEIVRPTLDLLLIGLAGLWSWVVTYGQISNPGSPLPFVSCVVLGRAIIYFTLKLHRSSWLHVSRFEVMWLAVSALAGSLVIGLILWLLPDPFTVSQLARPAIVLSTEAAFYLLFLFGVRMTARALATSRDAKSLRRVLIVGAGEAGRALAYQIQETGSRYQAVGFLDDSLGKQKRTYRGLKILGSTHQLGEIAQLTEADEAVVAITNLPPARLREILENGKESGIPVRILPPLGELLGGQPDFKAIREVRMEDLLPRPEVEFDVSSISAYLAGCTVLITGGGGSIGSELCRQALKAGAKSLLVLGRGENSVFEALQELSELKEEMSTDQANECDLVPVICDVRDKVALDQVFKLYSPEVVFHAAAHKHVPLMEQFPCEAVKNNILGTLNVVELSTANHVKHLVVVSTDKAVAPTNVMGATKRVTEMIIQSHRPNNHLSSVCVRFGNVLGSRGSVVPTMTRQIRRGMPITVTDTEMVRFFMTIPEAVQLILQAGAIGGHGEVFVLDMGHPVRILDLAHDLIRLHGMVPDKDIAINIVGKRPGEKMYEELLTHKELASAEKRGAFYVAAKQPIDGERFLRQVHRLIDLSQSCDTYGVVKLLSEVVPEFHPTGDFSRKNLKFTGQIVTSDKISV
jgi:FlaA1/EpsC-like NDP-sugar epimerase